MLQLVYLASEAAPELPKLGFIVNQPNAVSAFVMYFIQGIVVWIAVNYARAGKSLLEIRKIPGLDAFDEAIGRATEMGRPVHICNYDSTLGDGPTFAFWSFLSHVAKTCAAYDTRIIVLDRNRLANVVHQEIVRQAYLEAGRPEAFNPDDIRYESDSQHCWAAAVAGMVAREQVAAQFMVGYFQGESLIVAEAGNLVGAIQVAAQTATSQVPFLIATCDYVLIGEELYAGAAHISKEPVMTASVISQDIIRLGVFAMVIFGAILEIVAPQYNFLRKFVEF